MKRRDMLQGALAAGTLAAVPADANVRRKRGLHTLERITGSRWRAVVDGLADIAPALGEFILDFCYGDVIARQGLDLKTRELTTVAALAALGHAQPQLKVHVRGALNVGATRTEIVEVLLQAAVYAGFPAALNAIASAREAFDDADAGERGRSRRSRREVRHKRPAWWRWANLPRRCRPGHGTKSGSQGRRRA